QFLAQLAELAPAYYEVVEEEPVTTVSPEIEAVSDPVQPKSEPMPAVDRDAKPKTTPLEDWL
ncbi:MAG: signal recognition particle-docking protein FtsY, partial [Armatimonadetes bacterium]